MPGIAKSLIGIILVLSMAGTAFSQWALQGGETPLNPNSGEVLNPSFAYDPADGILYVENAGPNGIVESADNLTLLGDDIGLIQLLITAPQGTTVDSLLPEFGNGIAWRSLIFGDSVLLEGVAIAGSFLPITEEPVPLLQLTPGFGVDDFRDTDGNVKMEAVMNFTIDTPGETLFTVGDAAASGAFRVIPEPGAFGMLLLAAISMLKVRRR